MDQQTKTVVIDNTIATTWYSITPGLEDVVLKKVPYWAKLAESGNMKTEVPDGTHWEDSVKYAKMNQNSKWFGEGASFGRAEKETKTRLLWYPRNFGTAIVRKWDRERKNRGKAQIINYAANLVDETISSMRDDLANASLNQDSSGVSMHALETLITTTPTAGSIGGLTRSTNAYLQNTAIDFSGLTTGASLLDEMQRGVNLGSRWVGDDRPDLIVTTREIYQDYERIAQSMRQIVSQSTDKVSLGFADLMYKNIDMIWDDKCPAGNMYILNTSCLKLYVDPEYWFELTEWKTDPDTLDRYAQAVCVLQQACTNFQKQCVIHDITATTS